MRVNLLRRIQGAVERAERGDLTVRPAPLISPNLLKIKTSNQSYKSFIRVWDVMSYMGVDPLRSPPWPLGGKEGKSPTSSQKKTAISRKVSDF